MKRALRAAVASATLLSAAATALSLVNLRHLRRPPTGGSSARISVLVPARDEANRIGPTLKSLRDLQGVTEVVVLDDNSSDGTADLVRAAGLRVIASSAEPPDGWLGKPWACQRLAEAATGEVLVFLDADVEVSPDAAIRAAAMLDDVDLVCPYPRQITSGWLQRLVQPLLQWSWLTFLPLAVAERSAHPLLSAGNGQFLAVRRAAYFDAGGHASVRAEVLEDLALVRRFKATGHTAAMADGTQIATCRMYSGGRDLVEGYTKSLHAAFGARTVALLAWMYLLPAAAVISSDRRTRVLAATGYLAAVAGRVAVAVRTGQRPRDAVMHPLSIVTLVALWARSLYAERRGSIMWRGRPVRSQATGS